MLKTLFIKPETYAIRELYKHTNVNVAYNGDSGVDLIIPQEVICKKNEVTMIDHKICCEMIETIEDKQWWKIQGIYFTKNVPYFLAPRSSISKTPLIMANSIGIIDAGYRGNILGAVYNTSKKDYVIYKGTKLFQIILPSLEQFETKLVTKLSQSERGEKGFGSSTQTKSK